MESRHKLHTEGTRALRRGMMVNKRVLLDQSRMSN